MDATAARNERGGGPIKRIPSEQSSSTQKSVLSAYALNALISQEMNPAMRSQKLKPKPTATGKAYFSKPSQKNQNFPEAANQQRVNPHSPNAVQDVKAAGLSAVQNEAHLDGAAERKEPNDEFLEIEGTIPRNWVKVNRVEPKAGFPKSQLVPKATFSPYKVTMPGQAALLTFLPYQRGKSCPVFARAKQNLPSCPTETKRSKKQRFVTQAALPEIIAQPMPVNVKPKMQQQVAIPHEEFMPTITCFPSCAIQCDALAMNATRRRLLAEQEKSQAKSQTVDFHSVELPEAEVAELEKLRAENKVLLSDNLQLQSLCQEQQNQLSELRKEKIQEQRRQLQEIPSTNYAEQLLKENNALQRQLHDLGAAIYENAKRSGGASASVIAVLAAQLTDAHDQISYLKSEVQQANRAAVNAQKDIEEALKGINQGRKVFAIDPNDITIQEAAMDSILVQAKRNCTTGMELLWSTCVSIKETQTVVVERIKKFLKHETSLEDPMKQLQVLASAAEKHLNEIYKLYEDFQATNTSIRELKAHVFDPSRNSPYCPCRPRRMVLEEDLDHLQRQLFESNEQVRQLRGRTLQLELNSLSQYVSDALPMPHALIGAEGESAKETVSFLPQQGKLVGDTEIEELMGKIAAMETNIKKLNKELKHERNANREQEEFLVPNIFGDGEEGKLPANMNDLLSLFLALKERDGGNADLKAELAKRNRQANDHALRRFESSMSELHIKSDNGSLNTQERNVIKKIDEQAKELRKVNKEVQKIRCNRIQDSSSESTIFKDIGSSD